MRKGLREFRIRAFARPDVRREYDRLADEFAIPGTKFSRRAQMRRRSQIESVPRSRRWPGWKQRQTFGFDRDPATLRHHIGIPGPRSVSQGAAPAAGRRNSQANRRAAQ
jgi:hypothetical protein